jgi:hypothetical protein
VLLMDNCKGHMGDKVQKVLANYGVMTIMYALRTTNILQILEIILFSILKLIKSNADESGMVHEITNHVVKNRVTRQIYRHPFEELTLSPFRCGSLLSSHFTKKG